MSPERPTTRTQSGACIVTSEEGALMSTTATAHVVDLVTEAEPALEAPEHPS
jgi:hypothetical protein